jgi:hypothetical protein
MFRTSVPCGSNVQIDMAVEPTSVTLAHVAEGTSGRSR